MSSCPCRHRLSGKSESVPPEQVPWRLQVQEPLGHVTVALVPTTCSCENEPVGQLCAPSFAMQKRYGEVLGGVHWLPLHPPEVLLSAAHTRSSAAYATVPVAWPSPV